MPRADEPSARDATLAERLGHPPDARLVILSCDDLGAFHASNVAIFEALRAGRATCTSLMVPAPWARHAVAECRGEDVGVHLTLNAEHDRYRWGSITRSPSLEGGDGGFPRTLEDLWEHADPAEVRRECRAQIDRAVAWGLDPTHLSPHLTAITLRPEFFDVYLDLAAEYRLPIRLPSTITHEEAGFPFRDLAREAGVVFPDHFDHDWTWGSRARVLDQLARLEPGVTEIHVQPCVDSPEVRALGAESRHWIDDHAFVTADPALPEALARAGATPIGYRELRRVMRGD
jgi:predicted glycoside hydrolase/deacetylase ChbG (UPF0249 family)